MENSIFNCLMTNFVGAGKQFLPQTDADAAGQGQNGFFALFSEKMNGIFGTMLPQSMNDATFEPGKSEEKGDASVEGPEASSDHSRIVFFVSSLIAAIDQQATQSLPEEADLPAITEFLNNILEILSGGDEIEFKGNAINTAGTGSSEKETRQNGVDQAAAASFVGSLAVFLAAFNKMARQDTDAGSLPDKGNQAGLRQVERIVPARLENEPDTARAAMADVGPRPAAKGEPREELSETPAFLVQVTKSSKENKIVDISMNDQRLRFSPPVESTDERAENIPDHWDENIEDRSDTDRMIIRVAEKEEPDLKGDAGDRQANENDINMHGHSQPNNEQNKTEIHKAGKNDFGAMMVEKIEKITEQYSGKNLGMDMTVKLKIDDNETILVGLRGEGSRVTVEVKTANENTMNFIQSQKDDLVKNLENKHIMTTIHVDIDQDARERQQHNRRQESGQDSPDEHEDFGTFFEAMA